MFKKSAHFYDLIYQQKDYAGEANKIRGFIQQHKQSAGNTLLDVACGTGAHIPYLRDHYQIEGLDLDDGMLDVARQRHPDETFHVGDMRDFDLDQTYDVIVCLFSAIAYVKTLDGLGQALGCFARHLKPGGVAIVEGFVNPAKWRSGHIPLGVAEDSDLKIVRMSHNEIIDRVAVLNFHYLVGTPDEVSYFTERHELALFTDDEYLNAFRGAGLDVTLVAGGLMRDRGLFIGVRPLP